MISGYIFLFGLVIWGLAMGIKASGLSQRAKNASYFAIRIVAMTIILLFILVVAFIVIGLSRHGYNATD